MSSNKNESAADREKRLAKALRENLKRRKAQVRDKAKGLAGDKDKTPPGTGKKVNKESD